MSDIYEHANDSDTFSFDRETLGQIPVNYPWAVRFAVAEAVLVSLTGVIPLLGASDFHYVLFGMLASLAGLGAVVVLLIGLVVGLRRGVAELRRSVDGLPR